MARFIRGATNNGDVIALGNSITLCPQPPNTISGFFWVRAFTNAFAGIFARRVTTGTNGAAYIIAIGGSANQLDFQPASATGVAISTSTWNHFAQTFSGTTCTAYLNGTQVGTNTGASFTSDTAHSTWIGNDNDNSTLRSFDGYLAHFALWTVALTAAEISSLAKGFLPFRIRKPVAYLPLDGLQSPEPDLSGNRFNGTLTGTTLAPFGPPVDMFTRPPMTPPPALPYYTTRKQARMNILQTGP